MSADVAEVKGGKGGARKTALVCFVGDKSVGALTELFHAISTCGNCMSQSVFCWSPTMASMRAMVG